MPEPTSGAASQGPDRAAILAEMAALPGDGTAATTAKPAPKAKQVTPPPAETEAPDQEAAPDVEPEPEAEVDAPAEEQPDAETQKRLDMVTRAEKRSRQQLTKERQDLELERREHLEATRAHKAEVESFSKLKARAKYDAVGVLRGLGLTEDDFELAAQQLYTHSKAGAADPKRRAAVESATKERELRDEIAELRKWRDDQEQAKQKQAVEQTQQQRAAEYGEKMLSQVSEAATPFVHRQLAKNPGKAMEGLVKTYADLAAELDGEIPDHADVVKAYEKRRRAELEEEGVDVASLIGKKPAVPVTKPARTLGRGNATNATRPKADGIKRAPNGQLAPESRDEILKEMASLSDE